MHPIWDNMDRYDTVKPLSLNSPAFIFQADCASRQMGQLFMMGFDGNTVDQQIRSLIEDYHVGNILLNAKNLKCK